MSQSSTDSPGDSLSSVVIETVAERMDVDPIELPQLLDEVIDADALNSLFAGRTGTDGAVTFTYCGYTVTVTAAGAVSAEE